MNIMPPGVHTKQLYQADALVWQEQISTKSFMGLIQGCTNFPTSQPPKNFGDQNSDIKQVPY
jgi:hypothetical protein